MSSTPRPTPVVEAPPGTSPVANTVRHSKLKAPIVVVAAGKEWEHESGVLVIGRDAEANVVVEDPLVSRFHARLLVGPDGQVMLEDLHSANGVFVNGNKLLRPSVALGEGDRLLLGTTEVSVFSLRASATVLVGKRLSKAPVSTRAATALRRQSSATSAEVKLSPKRTASTTGRKDAVDMVAQFAEQLMESGHALEAVRVQSEHLQNLLKGAAAGLNVPLAILESATRYALRLHGWTQQDAWLEYVLELHLTCQQVPSDRSLLALEVAFRTAVSVDRSLLNYFVRTIEERAGALASDAQLRLRRIEQLGQ